MKIIGWIDKQTGYKRHTLDWYISELKEFSRACEMISAAFVGLRDALANLANIQIDTTH